MEAARGTARASQVRSWYRLFARELAQAPEAGSPASGPACGIIRAIIKDAGKDGGGSGDDIVQLPSAPMRKPSSEGNGRPTLSCDPNRLSWGVCRRTFRVVLSRKGLLCCYTEDRAGCTSSIPSLLF